MIREVCFGLANRHRDYDGRLHERVRRQDPALVANCATTEARKLYRMHNEVMRCLHAKKGFLRLKISGHGILYADADLEHDVADLILAHFHRRYPTYHIALEHRRSTYIAAPDGRVTITDEQVEDAVRRLEGSLPKDGTINAGNEPLIWRQYYDSQRIRERRNTGLMDKMMPQRYRDKDAYENSAEQETKSILEYA